MQEIMQEIILDLETGAQTVQEYTPRPMPEQTPVVTTEQLLADLILTLVETGVL